MIEALLRIIGNVLRGLTMASCFSLDWFEHVLIAAIIIVALIAFLRIVASGVLTSIGVSIPAWIIEAIKIIVWAVVAIVFVVIIFTLLKCLFHF